MTGRTPQEAYQKFVTPLRAAIGCVSQGRLTLERGQATTLLMLGTSYTLALNDMVPTALRGALPITISIALEFRVLELHGTPDPFAVATTRYFYVLATSAGDEVLSFHWTPDAIGRGEVLFPHLHVVTDATQVLPRTFHKVHVPTGFVSLPSVIRLAIAEFGVRPLPGQTGGTFSIRQKPHPHGKTTGIPIVECLSSGF